MCTYFPASQFLHAIAARPLYLPAPHSMHVVLSREARLPEAHALQKPLPTVVLTNPLEQSKQPTIDKAPEVENLPAGQPKQPFAVEL